MIGRGELPTAEVLVQCTCGATSGGSVYADWTVEVDGFTVVAGTHLGCGGEVRYFHPLGRAAVA